MNDAVYTEAFRFLIEIETDKFTNDPDDSGGPTKWGITQKAYSAFIGYAATAEDIAALTEEQAQIFYFQNYWRPLKCANISHLTVALCLFDTAVLYGVGTAALMAQEACGLVGGAVLKFDGIIGDKSLAAINSIDEVKFVKAYYAMILRRIDSVVATYPKNAKYRTGWASRAKRLLTLIGDAAFNIGDA
jgi:lysozyme family protein